MGMREDLGLSESVECHKCHNEYSKATPRGRDYFKKQLASLIIVTGGGFIASAEPGVILGGWMLSVPLSYYWSSGAEEIPDDEKEEFKNV